MDILDIIKILRQKFSEISFFARVYHIEDSIVIYNDSKIILNYNKNLFNLSNIDDMKKKIMDDIKKKIEEIYKTPNDLISVIIPNYNNELFLKNVISKILANTYKNIELLIIDDKSTDSSVQIIKDFYKNEIDCKKIKLYENKENSGSYYCQNKGILMSSGGYILFIGGDDYIEPTFIENMYNGLKKRSNNVWGYGTRFTRLFLDKNLDILSKNITGSYSIIFRRKLYNYLGFYQNNRFGADTEFRNRAKKFGYYIKYNGSINAIQYYANTIKNKNLTETISKNLRKRYIYKANQNIKSHGYIEMAFLD